MKTEPSRIQVKLKIDDQKEGREAIMDFPGSTACAEGTFEFRYVAL